MTITTTTTTHAPGTTVTAHERGIEGIYPSPGLHWVGDGFRVAGIFSVIPNAARKLDPFLLLDYAPEYEYAPTTKRRGVGVHPHRGFETVTFAIKGSVAHHDSAGGGGIIGPGDVQWMTAASGILHKEFHSDEFARAGGAFQMVQLWVNLPSSEKMGAPGYQPILASDIVEAELQDGAGKVRVIAGEFAGVRGPAKTKSPIRMIDTHLRAGHSASFDFPSSETLAMLVIEGDLHVQGENLAQEGEFVVFRHDGEKAKIEALTNARVLVLNGEPLNEPIVQYGPFVMNTQQEIRQAMVDFSSGAFGHLAD